MSASNCPECGKPGRMLMVHGAWVDYFVCDRCHTAWTLDSRDPKATPMVIVTKPGLKPR